MWLLQKSLDLSRTLVPEASRCFSQSKLEDASSGASKNVWAQEFDASICFVFCFCRCKLSAMSFLRCIIHIMVACATFRAFFAASPVQSCLKSLGGLSRRRALMVQTAIFYVKHCNITQYKCIVCCMVIEGKEACCCTSSDSGNLKLDCLSGAVTTLMLMAGTFGVPVCLPPMRT